MRHSIKHFLLGILPILLFVDSCKKHLPGNDITEAGMVSQARAFIDSLNTTGYPVNYRAAQPKTIRWDLAQVVPIGQSEGILVPIVFDNALLVRANFVGDPLFHLDYLTQLLYYKDGAGSNTVRVITAFPDSSYFKDPTRPFTGIKFIEDWLGHPIEKLLYTSDGHIKRYVAATKRSDALDVIQTCYTITGYNYSPELGETSSWSEDAGCMTEYLDDGSAQSLAGGSGGASSGGTTSVAASFTVLPGNSVIKSIKSYFQCFVNAGGTGYTYTVTVCVDQPDPGTRTPWTTSGTGSSGSSAGNNVVNVGHTFLILTENYGNTTITRNVGFYPGTDVNPVDMTSQGTLNDDETHSYNISGSFTVDNAQFFNILNFIGQGSSSGYLYNLNTNNCTTFVIDAAAQGGIDLPRTIGTWLGGAGNDPGDLGEDLRMNNISGMTLNLLGGTQVSHYNEGQCN
jgi:hypothetical protein